MAISHLHSDLLLFLLSSKTTHGLFLSFSYHKRINFLSQFVENYLSCSTEKDYELNPEQESLVFISGIFKNEICMRPYSPIAMLVYLYIQPDIERLKRAYSQVMD